MREIEQTLLYARALHARDGPTLDLEPWVNSVEQATRAVLPIRMTDRDGMITLSDLRRPANPIDLSDRSYIRHFADWRPARPVTGCSSERPPAPPADGR